MGAAQNEGTSTELQLHHRHLRNCRALTRDTTTVLVATLPSQIPTVAKWKEQLAHLQEAQPDRTYLLLPLSHHFEEGGVCSNTGELTIEYDHYPQLLSSQITERKKDARRFSEKELWYLLLAIVQAKCELDGSSHNLGDLQPGNIFLNAQQQVKVASLYSWPGQTTSYRRAIHDEQTSYLAPEDVQRLKLGAMDNRGNSESEMFAIGMTLLSTSLLNLNQDLYNIREREFDVNLFQQRLSTFLQDNNYSQIYKAIVCNLLEIDPAKRLTLHDLRQLLIKHKEPVVARKSFVIDSVPRKLQQSINLIVQQYPNQQQPTQQPTQQHPQQQIGHSQQAFAQPSPPQPQPQTVYQPLHGSRQQLIAQTEPRNIRQSGVSASKGTPQRIMNFINFEGTKQGVSNPSSATTIPSNPNIHPFHSNPNIPIVPRQQLPINTPRQPLISAQPDQARTNVPRGYSPQRPIEMPIKNQYIDNQPKFRPFQVLNNQYENQIQPQQRPNYNQPRTIPQYQPPIQHQVQREPLFDSFARARSNSNGKLIEENKPAEAWENNEKSMVKQLNLLMETKKEGFGLNQKNFERNGLQSPVRQCQSAYQSPEQPKRQESPIQPASHHDLSSRQPLSPQKSADLHYEADASSFAEQDVSPSSNLQMKPVNEHYLSHTISEPSYENQSSAQFSNPSNAYQRDESLSINAHYSIGNPSGHFNEERMEHNGSGFQPSQISDNYHEVENIQPIQPSLHSNEDQSLDSLHSKLKEDHLSLQQLSYQVSNMAQIEVPSIPKLPLESVTPVPAEAPSSIMSQQSPKTKSSIIEPILIVQQNIRKATTIPSPISQPIQQVTQPFNNFPQIQSTSSFTPPLSLPNPSVTEPISKLSQVVSLPINPSTPQKPSSEQNITKPTAPTNPVPNLFANLLASTTRFASPPSSFTAAKAVAQIAPSSETAQPEVKVIDGQDTSTKTAVEALKQQHQIETIEFESIANYQQFASSKFSPMVKVWGLQKGELKVKDMGTIQQASLNTGTVINQLSSPESNKESSYPSSQATPRFPAASRASNIEDSPPKQNNFILIEESKLAAQNSNIPKQVQQSNDAFLRTNPISKLQEASGVPISSNDQQAIHQKNQKEQVLEDQEQVDEDDSENYHTYVDIATDGTFEQCWQELIKIIETPHNYCRAINGEKVRLQKGNQWNVKIGPAFMSIEANKEQGKILLSSRQESKTQGEVLAGVFKDEDKKQRIWFNSALYYKNQPFPPRNILEEALKQARSMF